MRDRQGPSSFSPRFNKLSMNLLPFVSSIVLIITQITGFCNLFLGAPIVVSLFYISTVVKDVISTGVFPVYARLVHFVRFISEPQSLKLPWSQATFHAVIAIPMILMVTSRHNTLMSLAPRLSLIPSLLRLILMLCIVPSVLPLMF